MTSIQKDTKKNLSTLDDAVLTALRGLTEPQLHTQVIRPLLASIGDHVQYVHGSEEGGKDFVYVTTDAYGETVLEVCQVKSKRFSTRAEDTQNLIGILNQLQSCAQLEVTNPLTNINELPHQTTLITTYPMPQRATTRIDTLLRNLRASRCRIIGPDRLLELLRQHASEVYNQFAFPGDGVARSLQRYVSQHHEASAFIARSERLLSEFFVDIGITSQTTYHCPLKLFAENSNVEIGESSYSELCAFQDSLPPPLAGFQIADFSVLLENTSHGHTKQRDRYVLKSLRSRKFLHQAHQQIATLCKQASSQSIAKAIDVLLSVSALISFVRQSILPDTSLLQRQEYWPLKDLTIGNVSPLSVLQLNSSFLIRASAGAGKTSFARELSNAALQSGSKCVYFPCHRLETGVPLKEAIVNFLCSISGQNRESAIQFLESVDLIVLDGCDEAATVGEGLEEEISKLFQGLCLQRGIVCDLGEPLTESNDPKDIPFNNPDGIPLQFLNGRDQKSAAIAPQWPLRTLDFLRLRRLNPSLDYVLKDFQETYISKAPSLVLTMRNETKFAGSATMWSVGLAPFTNHQLRKFFGRWFRDKKKVVYVWNFLKENIHILEVCRSPIVATLLAAMHENGYSLPYSRTELYSQRFSLLLGKWDASKGLRRPTSIPSREKLILLSKLALDCHMARVRQFTRDQFISLWHDRFSLVYPRIDPDNILCELRVHNGVIQTDGPCLFSFGHLSFQEYLAAHQASLSSKMEEYLLERFEVPWWRSMLVFYAGLRADIGDFLNQLSSSNEWFFTSSKSQGLACEMVKEARFTKAEVRAFFADIDLSDIELLDNIPGCRPVSSPEFDPISRDDEYWDYSSDDNREFPKIPW